MARARYSNNVPTYDGLTLRRIPNATVTLFVAGTTTPLSDTIYAGPTGGTALPNPFTTDAAGNILFYLDTPKDVKVRVQGAGVPAFDMDYEQVRAASGDEITQASGLFYLMNYAAGLSINDGTTLANAAFTAAFSAITTSGITGAKLVMPPGRIRCSNVTVPSYVTLEGSGDGTVLVHPPSTNNVVVNIQNTVGVTLRNFKVDGNYAGNNNPTTGFLGQEITTTGAKDFVIQNVTAYDYNQIGIEVSGENALYDNCEAAGVGHPIGDSYPSHTSHDARSTYGFWSPLSGKRRNITMRNCKAHSNKSAGMILSSDGTGAFVIDAPILYDNHRGTYPDGTPGGQLAFSGFAELMDGLNLVPTPASVTINAPQIGPVGAGGGGYCSGIEIGGAVNVVINGPQINGQANWGISFAPTVVSGEPTVGCERLTVNGGSITNCGLQGLRLAGAKHVDVNGTTFTACGTATPSAAIVVEDTAGIVSDVLRFRGVGGSNNGGGGSPQNWQFIGTGVNIEIINEQFTTGAVAGNRLQRVTSILTAQPNVFALSAFNVSTGGPGVASNGLYVAGGSTGSDILLRLVNGSAASRFEVNGAGTVSLSPSSGTLPMVISRPEGAAALLAYLAMVRNGGVKAWLGLDASDRLTIMKPDGSATGWYVDPANGNMVVPGTLSVNGEPTVKPAVMTNGAGYALTTGAADVTGAAITIPSAGHWRIEAAVNWLIGAGDAGNLAIASLSTSAGTLVATSANQRLIATNDRYNGYLFGDLVLSSGTATVKLRAQRSAGGAPDSQIESWWLHAVYEGK